MKLHRFSYAFRKVSFTLLFSVLLMSTSYSQPFIKKESGKKMTFVEMQRQFDQFAKTHDLTKTKNWKYYKRWENDMQRKTNGRGELADPAIYMDEAVKIANTKNAKLTPSAFSATGWSPLGPNVLPGNLTGYMQTGIGRINCMAFHPTIPSTYFAGVAQGGLWKTTNNGLTWTPLTDNLPINRISDIVIDPANTNIMYISVCDFEYIDVALNIDGRKRNTHYGLGVYKTTDGGLTWNPTGLSFQLTDGDASLIRKILINKTNSNNLAACGVSGIYTSSNAGTTWTKVLDSLCWDLVQDPVLPNTLYATSGWLIFSGKGYAAIYKSTDFGATWTVLPSGIPGTGFVQRIKLAIAPSDNNYIYAITVNYVGGSAGVYKSIDAGVSWSYITPLSSPNVLEPNAGWDDEGQGTYDLGFSVNRFDKNIVYVGGINIWTSTDGGITFQQASHWSNTYGPTLHSDIHFIETNPLTNDIFVCSDGGLYKTDTIKGHSWTAAVGGTVWPTNWTYLSNGMNITSFYRLSSSKNTKGRLCAGAQDNATMYYNGSNWNTVFADDGMDNYLDPLNDNAVFGTSQYGVFHLSVNGGVSTVTNNANFNGEEAEWVTPLVADYNIPGTIYAGFVNVQKSTNGGTIWTALNPLPTHPIYDNEICALAVANSNSNVLYAARRVRFEYGSNSTLFTTTDGGNTWTDITSILPDTLYFTSLDVSQTNASIAYVTLSGFITGQKVYKTTDGGASWTNISFNLPNIPINCIKTTPGTNRIMIATDFGIYLLDEGTNTWISENTGLPNVIVTDIEFNPALNKIYISTFGRGIWETSLSAMIGVKENPYATIGLELFPTINDGSFTLQLTDQSLTNEILNLEIIDIMGKLVYSSVLKGQTSYKQNLDLPSGMYFARILNNKIYGVKNFVVK